jgi:YidC/Oxa1 family membrane protein insertase
MGENRNFLLAAVIAIGILLLYQVFVLDPMARDREAAEAAIAASQAETTNTDDAPQAEPSAFAPGSGENGLSREDALARSQRIEIRTEAVSGSLSLTGARLDDLQLLRYDTEVDSGEAVTLLSPEGFDGYQFAASGWLGDANAPQGLPGLSTQWTLAEGDVLTPDTPVVLEHQAGDLTFRRTITVDDNYLFTVSDSVVNNGSAAVSLRPYSLVRQHGVPQDLQNFFVLHEGAVGVVDGTHFSRKFKKWEDEGLIERSGPGGWMGITSKYWLAAVAPQDQGNVRAQFRVVSRPDRPVFEANYLSDAQILAPGASLEASSYVFAGAKKQPILAAYENELGIDRLTMAIDWGMFWFLTRPFFAALHFFYGLLGNYGLAIMVVTLLIKLVLFPLNNRAFASMAKMRSAAPKMKEIRERHKDDPQAQQKAMMELYRKERINPVAGCLPILPQIPIFFALYKTVFISLDARHAPFFGWIQDMSAPDPTMFGNLFGLLPYDPSGIPADRSDPGDRRLAAADGRDHVGAAIAEPAAAGQDPASDLRVHADHLHHHHGALPGRPDHLLVVEQHADHRPAIPDHAPSGRGDRAGPQLLQGPRQAHRLGRARKIPGRGHPDRHQSGDRGQGGESRHRTGGRRQR